jgi:hypothetical protein
VLTAVPNEKAAEEKRNARKVRCMTSLLFKRTKYLIQFKGRVNSFCGIKRYLRFTGAGKLAKTAGTGSV